MDLFRAAVLTHDDDLLAGIPKHELLDAVDLRDLGLPAPIAGNDMAEARFFLSEAADELGADAEYVGVLPARWDERFPRWPRLVDIDRLEPMLSPHVLLAPSASPLPVALLDDWIALQDQVHPGISSVLWQVPARPVVGRVGNPVWGNSFIVHRSVYLDLVAFVRRAFDVVHERYGFGLPYAYRCPRCGYGSDRAVGRWTDSRHASYFYERVTSIYFAARGDLVLVDGQGAARPVKQQERIFSWLPAALRRPVVARRATMTRRNAPCAGSQGAACA